MLENIRRDKGVLDKIMDVAYISKNNQIKIKKEA